jgi:CRISPR system Cascade subunit CasD
MANTLFLRLEGPMQSWGERARWSVRDSAPEPTKSGIVGLLGCALGLKDDADLQALSRAIRLGIRCDRPGEPLIDYHTIAGGVLSAEGKIKKTASTGEPGTVVTWRTYLCDASFLAAVHAAPELIDRLAQGAQHPVWPVYLGRRSCPPAKPLFEGVGEYSSLEEALQDRPFERTGAVRVRAVIECGSGEGVQRRDELDSNRRRTFLPRYTRELLLTFPAASQEVS